MAEFTLHRVPVDAQRAVADSRLAEITDAELFHRLTTNSRSHLLDVDEETVRARTEAHLDHVYRAANGDPDGGWYRFDGRKWCIAVNRADGPTSLLSQ